MLHGRRAGPAAPGDLTTRLMTAALLASPRTATGHEVTHRRGPARPFRDCRDLRHFAASRRTSCTFMPREPVVRGHGLSCTQDKRPRRGCRLRGRVGDGAARHGVRDLAEPYPGCLAGFEIAMPPGIRRCEAGGVNVPCSSARSNSIAGRRPLVGLEVGTALDGCRAAYRPRAKPGVGGQ